MNITEQYKIHEVGLVDCNRKTDFRLLKSLVSRIIKIERRTSQDLKYMIRTCAISGLFECVKLDIGFIQLPLQGCSFEDGVLVSSIRNLQKELMNFRHVDFDRLRLIYTLQQTYPEFFDIPFKIDSQQSIEALPLSDVKLTNPYVYIRFTMSELYKFGRLMNFLNIETIPERYSLMSDGTMMYQVEKSFVDSSYLKLSFDDQELDEEYKKVLESVYAFNKKCSERKMRSSCIPTFCLCDTIGVGFLENWKKFCIRLQENEKNNKVLVQFCTDLHQHLDSLEQQCSITDSKTETED